MTRKEYKQTLEYTEKEKQNVWFLIGILNCKFNIYKDKKIKDLIKRLIERSI